MKLVEPGIANALVASGLLALASLTSALRPACAEEPVSGAAAQSDRLRIAGNPSVVRFSRFTWQGAPSEPTCFVFDIRFRNPVVVAEISTSGLGRTLLAAARTDSAQPDPHPMAQSSVACDGKAAWQELLRLQMLERSESIDWRISVKLDTSSLLADGTSIDGQILVSTDGGRAIGIPLKVERLPMAPVVTALTWFVGIVVPAWLAYWLARLSEARIDRKKHEAERVEAERKREEDFLVWRQDPKSVELLDEFFGQQLPAAGGLRHPCTTLFDWMHSHSMLAKIPPAEFEALIETCRIDDRPGFLDQLQMLFPERRDQIPAQFK